MDIGITDTLDIDFEVEDNSAPLIFALFTDARVANKRGYWLDIPQSELWILDQSRDDGERVLQVDEELLKTNQIMVDAGVYTTIESECSIVGSRFNINFKAKTNDGQVNRSIQL